VGELDLDRDSRVADQYAGVRSVSSAGGGPDHWHLPLLLAAELAFAEPVPFADGQDRGDPGNGAGVSQA
jgi:hypothetical protein